MFFIDMDGVLARWNPQASIEDTYEPGYFLNREVEPQIVSLIRMLIGTGKRVAILSSVYPTGCARKDKDVWLDRIGLPEIRRIFVPYGEDKHRYIPDLTEPMVLLDDYSKNLRAWVNAGHIGVKFYNGINGTKGSWKGPAIWLDMQVKDMYAHLISSEQRCRSR